MGMRRRLVGSAGWVLGSTAVRRMRMRKLRLCRAPGHVTSDREIEVEVPIGGRGGAMSTMRDQQSTEDAPHHEIEITSASMTGDESTRESGADTIARGRAALDVDERKAMGTDGEGRRTNDLEAVTELSGTGDEGGAEAEAELAHHLPTADADAATTADTKTCENPQTSS